MEKWEEKRARSGGKVAGGNPDGDCGSTLPGTSRGFGGAPPQEHAVHLAEHSGFVVGRERILNDSKGRSPRSKDYTWQQCVRISALSWESRWSVKPT
eukprot:1286130-Amphidinium_carterae.1